MQRLRNATLAYVAQPNTAETDAKPFVDHVVEGTLLTGEPFKVIVTASDPMHANERVATMPDPAFAGLRRPAAP